MFYIIYEKIGKPSRILGLPIKPLRLLLLCGVVYYLVSKSSVECNYKTNTQNNVVNRYKEINIKNDIQKNKSNDNILISIRGRGL